MTGSVPLPVGTEAGCRPAIADDDEWLPSPRCETTGLRRHRTDPMIELIFRPATRAGGFM